jgi:hypothetical protein
MVGHFSTPIDNPDIVTVISRGAQDILVIPKEDIHLLHGETTQTKRFRRDFHKAFTSINPAQLAYYNPETDYIEWHDRSANVASNFIPIPERTEAAEIEARRLFIETLKNEELKTPLSEALEMDWPLSVFAKVVRRLGLIFQWYDFRLNDVVINIKKWANAASIQFRDSWIVSDMTNAVPMQSTPEIAERQLIEGLKRLDSADLARITVPLDLVLKILRK